jgi:hypothetical protein
LLKTTSRTRFISKAKSTQGRQSIISFTSFVRLKKSPAQPLETQHERPDAVERLRDKVKHYWSQDRYTLLADDARAILDHITALTAERDAAVAEVAQMRDLCRRWHSYLTGPDEMGDYIRERQLRDELAIAAGAHLKA